MGKRRGWAALVLLLSSSALVGTVQGASNPLRGSRASLIVQNQVARDHDFTYLESAADVRDFVADGYLVRVRPSADVRLVRVSFPYARPEVKLFVDRLGAQYRAACGEPLVVTSLTRPKSRQPRNASKLSVHPTGMAVDLRRPAKPRCRAWLERVLIALQQEMVLEATRERRPPHYHVALFPGPYARYVARLSDDGAPDEPPTLAALQPSPPAEEVAATVEYRVRRGDTLWTISRRHATTVRELLAANHLSRPRIRPGQLLTIPVAEMARR